jgi:hypothetical protein
MKVRATKQGYDGIAVRQPDEEFEMPEGVKGSWFVPVKADPPPKARRAAQAEPSAEDLG